MVSFDRALDDYLHVIVRTRPWDVKREEDQLATFGEWLSTQKQIPDNLSSITPALVAGYVAADAVEPAEHDELAEALYNFCRWAMHQGLLNDSLITPGTSV